MAHATMLVTRASIRRPQTPLRPRRAVRSKAAGGVTGWSHKTICGRHAPKLHKGFRRIGGRPASHESAVASRGAACALCHAACMTRPSRRAKARLLRSQTAQIRLPRSYNGGWPDHCDKGRARGGLSLVLVHLCDERFIFFERSMPFAEAPRYGWPRKPCGTHDPGQHYRYTLVSGVSQPGIRESLQSLDLP